MNCKKCGNVLNPTDVICPSCGEPVNPPAPMTSSVQEVATSAPVATPMATTDVAVNPNVIMQPNEAASAPAPVSPVQEVATNGPVATPMATTDVAVNPSVIVQPVTGAEPVAPVAPVANPVAEVPAPAVEPVQPVEQVVASVAPMTPPADPNMIASGVVPGIPAQAVNPMAQVQMQTPVAPAPVVANAPQAGNGAADTGKKKTDIKFIVIVAVLVILIIGLGAFVGIKLFGGDKKPAANTTNTVGDNNNNNTTEEDNNKDNNKENNNNTTTTPVAAAEEFTSNGYTFTVPSELKSSQDGDFLSFSDGDNFLVNLTVLPAIYDDLKSDKAVKDLVKELDVKEIDHTETRLNGIKYTLISYEVDNSFGIIFYSGLDDYHMAFGLAFGKEAKSYDTAFEYTSMIIKNAKTTSTFAPDDDKGKEYKINKDMLDNGKVESKEYKF